MNLCDWHKIISTSIHCGGKETKQSKNGKTDTHADGKINQGSGKKEMSTKFPEPNKNTRESSKQAAGKQNQDNSKGGKK